MLLRKSHIFTWTRKTRKMVGAKSGDTERQLLKNLEHNQLSVKSFLNSYPGTDTTFNYNRCSLELWMQLLLLQLPTALGWGSGEETNGKELQEHSLKLEINHHRFPLQSTGKWYRCHKTVQNEHHSSREPQTKSTLTNRLLNSLSLLVLPTMCMTSNRKDALYTPVCSKSNPSSETGISELYSFEKKCFLAKYLIVQMTKAWDGT